MLRKEETLWEAIPQKGNNKNSNKQTSKQKLVKIKALVKRKIIIHLEKWFKENYNISTQIMKYTKTRLKNKQIEVS